MLYYLPNARDDDQRQRMEMLEASGTCIFCPEYLCGPASTQTVLLESDSWLLVENQYPYAGTRHHFLMLPREHVERLHELPSAAKVGYWDFLDRVHQLYGLLSFAGRNGLPEHTGATIRHLHLHLIASDPESRTPVVLYLSSPK